MQTAPNNCMTEAAARANVSSAGISFRRTTANERTARAWTGGKKKQYESRYLTRKLQRGNGEWFEIAKTSRQTAALAGDVTEWKFLILIPTIDAAAPMNAPPHACPLGASLKISYVTDIESHPCTDGIILFHDMFP